MTATEELRRLLDKRGVEWRDMSDKHEWYTEWVPEMLVKHHHRHRTEPVGFFESTWRKKGEMATGLVLFGNKHHRYCINDLTPEQAIAATLGDVPCLPHFWTHDGMLHVELPKLPDSISVRLSDQRDREVHSARTWQYTRGNDGVGRTNDGLADLQAENANLRERITTQKQTIQAYRDESREWREVAERAQAENVKLRELADGWDFCSKTKSSTFDNCVGCPLFIQTPHSYRCARDERMRELGVEVNG